MKKLIAIFVSILISSMSNLYADGMKEISERFSKGAAEAVANLIPGEGITEVDIKIETKEEPTFSILGVRDIEKGESSNFFTQFSLRNADYANDGSFVGNFGLGYRMLTLDDSLLLGLNTFYDRDLRRGHERGSVGFEAKALALEFNLNSYHDLSNSVNANGVTEQAIGGIDYRLATQVPYVPWAEFSWTGYEHDADKASTNVKGDIYTLGLALTPNLLLDLALDENHNTEDGDTQSAKFIFVHPPKNNGPTLLDGWGDEFFAKKSMKDELSNKVERNNNLTVEIQGAVIFTKK